MLTNKYIYLKRHSSILTMSLCIAFTIPVWSQGLNIEDSGAIDFESAFRTSRSANRFIQSRGGFVVVPEAAPFIDITEDDAVLFDKDEAQLKPAALALLDRLGQSLSSGVLSDRNIQIEGHTCCLGTAEYNLDLSERRAQNVCQYLLEQYGINASRIRIVGYGESRSPSGNLTEEERRKNRRVRIVALGPSSEGSVLALDEFQTVQTRAISDGNAEELVKVTYFSRQHPTDHERPLQDRDTIPSNGSFKIRIQVYEGCHLYILGALSSGMGAFLVPDPADENLANGRWIDRTNEPLEFPGTAKSYQLDNVPGVETIAVVASRTPIGDSKLLTDSVGNMVNAEILPSTLQDYDSEIHAIRIIHVDH